MKYELELRYQATEGISIVYLYVDGKFVGQLDLEHGKKLDISSHID